MASTVIVPKGRAASLKKMSNAEIVFCAEYLANGMNGAAAVRVAWPKNKNPGPFVHRILQRPKVKAYLGKLLHNRLEQAGLETDAILNKLRIALHFDPINVFESVGDGVFRVKQLDEIPEEIRCCITKLKSKTKTLYDSDGNESGTETFIELEFMSRDKALEMAMKYRGLLEPDKMGGNVTINLGGFNLNDLKGANKGDGDYDVIESRITGK